MMKLARIKFLPIHVLFVLLALTACAEDDYVVSDAVLEEREKEGLLLYANDLDVDEYQNQDIEYGEITDERDNHVYRTITIAGMTWMAQNLEYAESVQTPNLKGKSWCYEDKPENCKKGGRLYSWFAAVDYDSTYKFLGTDRKGICPEGFVVPGWNEVQHLLYNQNLKPFQLKSVAGWLENDNNTDEIGFSALPAGARVKGKYINGGVDAYFWTDYASLAGFANIFNISYKSNVFDFSARDLENAYSLRCVKSAEKVSSSSSVVASSSSSSYEAPYSFGKMTDNRDDEVYRTLITKDQEWLAENLRYKSDSVICHTNLLGVCDSSNWYYLWKEAVEACPEGWHLPDSTEWRTLVDMFVSLHNDSEVDMLGFDDVAHRSYSSDGWGETVYDYYWAADENDTLAVQVRLGSSYVAFDKQSKRFALSVRCVKD